MSIGLSNTSNISPNVITPLSNHFLLNSSLTLDYTSLVYSLLHPALGRLENFFRPGPKEICHQSPTILDTLAYDPLLFTFDERQWCFQTEEQSTIMDWIPSN